MDAPSLSDVLKVAAGVAVGLLPSGFRVLRAWRKTETDLADEALHDAVERQNAAHANADPSDDADADARVARAAELRRKARRLQAIADALADETAK